MPHIAHVALLVRDYDEALAWFTGKLAFVMLEDTDLGGGKRWVRVAPKGGGVALLLAKAATPRQAAQIGDQAAGGSSCSWRRTISRATHEAFAARGVTFLEAPRHESYATVAVFEDLYGNKWDLLQSAKRS
ncbi:MAG: VOC family protein [Rhizomicrobium sp.]